MRTRFRGACNLLFMTIYGGTKMRKEDKDMKNIKIRTKLLLLIMIFAIGFFVFGYSANEIINEIKVNGPIYEKIVQQKDLVADILPPPEYIIESHLISFEIYNEENRATIDDLIAYQNTLEENYETRHKVWVDNLEDSEMKDLLVNKSYSTATEYFSIFNHEFVTAINKGDKDAARVILTEKMIPLYKEHRGYIDQIVEIANKNSAQVESYANETVYNSIARLVIIAVVLLVAATVISLFIIRIITKPLSFMINYLGVVAKGDFSGNIPDAIIKRKDEIGSIAKATLNMQKSIHKSIKKVVDSIKDETSLVNESITESDQSVLGLSKELEGVSEMAEKFSYSMQEIAASIEEISSTTESIKRAVEHVALRANNGASTSEEINERAIVLKQSAKKSQETLNEVQGIISHSIQEAIAKSKEVEKIRVLSGAIMDISSQTNLLALNASIESARVGEYGRGFAVVAEEIGKMAENSKATVCEIQETVETVFEAVNLLVGASEQTLEFFEEVVKSYDEMVQTGDNYENDATTVNDLVTNLSAISQELFVSVNTVTQALENISLISNDGAKGSVNIAETISVIVADAERVKKETARIKNSAGKLNESVLEFVV